MAQKWQGKVVLLTENLKFALGAGQELMTIGEVHDSLELVDTAKQGF